ncbi:MAG: hypothetical protein ACXADB_05330 [Candidatus Hermodarchaeia archaeon]|jgi:hypothetical protein
MAIAVVKAFESEAQEAALKQLFGGLIGADEIIPESQKVIVDCTNWPVSVSDNRVVVQAFGWNSGGDLTIEMLPVENYDGSGAQAIDDKVTLVIPNGTGGGQVIDNEVFRNATYLLITAQLGEPVSVNLDISLLGKNFPAG